MIKYLVVSALSLLFFVSACKKKDDSGPGNPAGEPRDSVSLYASLKPGNFWIYESYRVDSNGNGVPGTLQPGMPSVFDSVYVVSDTMIGGQLYHRLMKPRDIGDNQYETLYLRDSLDYMVGRDGRVEFALTDSVSVFLSRTYNYPNGPSDDSVLAVTWRKSNNILKTVPAGSFNTTGMMYEWTRYPFVASGEVISRRRQYFRYAKGVGIVSETLPFYLSVPDYVERRLVRYHVQ